MRTLFVLSLQVCLSAGLWAGEWQTVHQSGAEAYRKGAYADAVTFFESSAPLAAAPNERAINTNDLGAALFRTGRLAESKICFERALEMWGTLPASGDSMAEAAMGLSDAARALGDFAAAEKGVRAALAVTTMTVEHKAELRNELADMLREQDRIVEARPLFEATLQTKGISRLREIEALLGMADLDRRIRRLNASVDEWTKAIQLARETGDPIEEAIGLRGLALTRSNAGDPGAAEPLLRRSLEIFRQNSAHPYQVAAVLSCLASLYRQQNKYTLAEDTWREALELFGRTAGKEHPHIALIMESMAEMYSAEHRFDEAADYAARALAIMQRVLGPEAPPTAGALSTIALVKVRDKQPEAAARDYAAALDIMRRSNTMSDQVALSIMARYAEVLAILHRTQEAKQVRTELKAFRGR